MPQVSRSSEMKVDASKELKGFGGHKAEATARSTRMDNALADHETSSATRLRRQYGARVGRYFVDLSGPTRAFVFKNAKFRTACS